MLFCGEDFPWDVGDAREPFFVRVRVVPLRFFCADLGSCLNVRAYGGSSFNDTN